MSRIYRNAFCILGLLVIGGGIWFGWRLGLSVLLGGLIAVINFQWLASGVDRVLLKEGEKSVIAPAVRFLGRLILILAALFAIIQTSFLSLGGALAGLSIYVLSGMLEAILLMFEKEK